MKIIDCRVNEINYIEPHDFFYSIDRKSQPSILTGKGPDDISEHSVIGVCPVKSVTIESQDEIWNRLKKLNDSTEFHLFEYPVNRLGGIGFISYEALHSLENITKRTRDHFSFPLLNWVIYREYYFFDNRNKKSWHIVLNYETESEIRGDSYKDTGFNVSNLNPDKSMESYIESVEEIKEYIRDGEVYEVNLTQGIKGDFSGSPLSLFKKLYRENSAPYSAYLERENYAVVSNSPEQFLRVIGRAVETRPIKGTAPRSSDPEEDKRLQDELFRSPKNQAELYMIVDLMRNDLSRVCRIGSVRVETPKRVEHYTNVHHLVSIVRGELKENMDIIDLLKATFPGGSITGCPKVRCMEITEEIETSSRNLYTGTIFIMNREYLNSSIVIRSAVIKDGIIVFNSGGAVTIDSDPKEEYKEFLTKMGSIFKAVDYEGIV